VCVSDLPSLCFLNIGVAFRFVLFRSAHRRFSSSAVSQFIYGMDWRGIQIGELPYIAALYAEAREHLCGEQSWYHMIFHDFTEATPPGHTQIRRVPNPHVSPVHGIAISFNRCLARKNVLEYKCHR